MADLQSRSDVGIMTNATEVINEYTEAVDDTTLIFDRAEVTCSDKLKDEDHKLHEASQ